MSENFYASAYAGDGANVARMAGRLVTPLETNHSVEGETIYSSRIAIRRMSEAEDVLPLFVPSRLMTGLDGAGKVFVRAQLRSYNMARAGGAKLQLVLFARAIADIEPDAADMNEVSVVGKLVKRAKFRTTPFMREIADILIASERAYGKVDYIPAIAWGEDAHFASELPSGLRVKLTGRLQSRLYVKRLENGVSEERTAYELSVKTIEPVYT